MPSKRTIAERFWPKVDRRTIAECWLWLAYRNSDGYGKIGVNGRRENAHRIAWILTNGPIPDGLSVLHNCPSGDNPACCNPAHLWLGTQPDNIADMKAKGRQRSVSGDRHHMRAHPEAVPRGDLHPRSKLTGAIVLGARQAVAEKRTTVKALAALHGVAIPVMRRAVVGQTWKHL